MELDPSYKDILGIRKFTSANDLKPGSVVQFTYDNEQKYALVLNPKWEGKMHGLSLMELSPTKVKKLLADIRELSSVDAIYETYKNSEYTMDRPYRTYTINKIKTLREIYLKENPI